MSFSPKSTLFLPSTPILLFGISNTSLMHTMIPLQKPLVMQLLSRFIVIPSESEGSFVPRSFALAQDDTTTIWQRVISLTLKLNIGASAWDSD